MHKIFVLIGSLRFNSVFVMNGFIVRGMIKELADQIHLRY